MSERWRSTYDAWKTREPVEHRFEEELVWRVDGYTPHANEPVEVGEFHRKEDAYHASNRWLLRAWHDDREYSMDYWTDIHGHDLLADCTCWGRLDRNCPLHGEDPDRAWEERFER